MYAEFSINIAEESDIGVISPYNAQCGKISQLLSKSWPGIKIGNVEEYQGQVSCSISVLGIAPRSF